MIAERTWEPASRQDALEGWWHDERHATPEWHDFVRRRGPIFDKIPAAATWWRVSPLSWDDLRELHAITPDFRGGRVRLFAAHGLPRRPLRTTPSTWRGITLFGHARRGPFTVLEGNHRLLAAAVMGPHARPPLSMTVHVALFGGRCHWQPEP